MSNPPSERTDPVSMAEAAQSDTVVARGTVVKGEVHAECAVRVHGRVEGQVRCTGMLFVADGGGVHADVTASSARIAGEVVGDVVALDLVELLGAGRVTGDIRAARVVIADGATLRGTVTLRAAGPADAFGPARTTTPAVVSPTARAVAEQQQPQQQPPPARGLVERRVKPRLFLRRAAETTWPRSS